MFLFVSFLILKYVVGKIYDKKLQRQIESENFKSFRTAVMKDDFVRNFIKNSHLNSDVQNSFDELLRTANISEFVDVSIKYGIPIHHLLYQWNYVPAQDSPKHILNAVNDDCIQEIFQNLTDPGDFLSAAETCYRFQANALDCYPSKFKELSLSLENKSIGRYTGLCLGHATNFSQIFGHLIKSIELICGFDEDVLKTIAKNCGKTLTTLFIQYHDSCNLNELSHFVNLRIINIFSVSVPEIQLPENLVHIHLANIKIEGDLECIMKKFPKLKTLFLSDLDESLNDTAFNAFIMLNPHVEALHIVGNHNLSFSTIDSISERLPNLVGLTVSYNVGSTREYSEIVMHFSRFRQLKYLGIYLRCIDTSFYFPVDTLINFLITNIPTLETIHLLNVHDMDQAQSQLSKLENVGIVYSGHGLLLVKKSPTLSVA